MENTALLFNKFNSGSSLKMAINDLKVRSNNQYIKVPSIPGSLTPSKVLPLFDITEHKAIVCFVLPC